MMRLWIQLILLVLSTAVSGQANDPVLDSLEKPLKPGASSRMEAQRLRAIIWRYIRRIEDIGELNYISSLDSIYQCCITGKSGDPKYEEELFTDVQFFKGYALTNTDPNASRPLIESAIQKFRAMGDSTRTALGFMELSWTLSNLGDSSSFVQIMEQAIKLIPHLTDPYIVINVQTSFGVGCYEFGMYAQAASHYFDALQIIEKERTIELLNAQRDLFHNLGGVYRRLGDSENALLYVRKAIESAKETQQDTLDHYLLLARIFIEKKDFKEALHALKLTQNYEFVRANAIHIGLNAYSHATCYRNLGQLDSALLYARKAVKLLPFSLNAQHGGAAMLELASCEFTLGIDSALQHADTAFVYLERAKFTAGLVEVTLLLSNIYKAKGDYLRALEYSEMRAGYQNQIERLQSNRQLAFGEFTRESAVENARREAEVKAQLDQQRNIRYVLFAGLGILALLIFLLFNRYRYKQRITLQLEAKNAEVEAARIRAEQSEAFKTRFLANMSHEIRTPLHGISGFTELLNDTSLTEKQRHWLGAIRQSSVRLKDVVNDILDLSKLEAGEVTLRKVAFSPERVAREVKEALQPRVEEKKISLEVDIDSDVPAAVFGDPTRLYQVLINLVGNAVKFTESGKVTIALQVQPCDHADSANILFSVIDTGIGIPPDRLDAVFESFQQAEESTTAKFGGTGLGLTIARDLVHLFGSEISVESQVGVGSRFSFDLVLPLADVDMLEHSPRHTTDVYTQPIYVLVVDDNAFNREISQEALHRHFENVSIDFGINGKEAVEKVSLHTYDVILMDMQMPEMNGLEATRLIREMEGEKSKVPIIALTAAAMQEEIESALTAGMNRHLGKPFQPEDLVAVIADLLNLDEDSGQKANTNHVVDPNPLNSFEGLDLRFLYDFCQGDETQMKYFLGKFIKQLPLEIERMEAAFASGDKEQVYKVAHSFRPQLDFVGLKDESALLLQIEQGAKQNEPLARLITMFQPINRLKDSFNNLSIKSDASGFQD